MSGNRISCLFGLLFALYIIRESFGIDVGEFHEPGPGFFPLVGGILLAVLATILLLQSILVKSRTMDSTAQGERVNSRLPVYTLIGLLVYALIFNRLGFLLSTFLLVIFLSKLLEHKKWWGILLTAGIVSLAFYTIFDVLLRSGLPKGILEVFF